MGGYAEDVGVNEDAELAIRLGRIGGVWYDPDIRSRYAPRARASARWLASSTGTATRVRSPFAITPRRSDSGSWHRRCSSSPSRRPGGAKVLAVYGAGIVARSAVEAVRDPKAAPGFAASLPTMHVSWGVGFLAGLRYQNTLPAGAVQRGRASR